MTEHKRLETEFPYGFKDHVEAIVNGLKDAGALGQNEALHIAGEFNVVACDKDGNELSREMVNPHFLVHILPNSSRVRVDFALSENPLESAKNLDWSFAAYHDSCWTTDGIHRSLEKAFWKAHEALETKHGNKIHAVRVETGLAYQSNCGAVVPVDYERAKPGEPQYNPETVPDSFMNERPIFPDGPARSPFSPRQPS